MMQVAKNSSRFWFDVLVTVAASALYYLVSVLFVNSTVLSAWGLVELLIVVAIFILINCFLVWKALTSKRYGLLTPLFLTLLIYLSQIVIKREQIAKQITYQNFSEKLPELSESISAGDVSRFNKALDLNMDKIDEIYSILYSNCRSEKQVNICEALLQKKVICTFCFDDLIVLGLKDKAFSRLLPLISKTLLQSEHWRDNIKSVTQGLTSEGNIPRYIFLQSLFDEVTDKTLKIPLDFFDMYLIDKPEELSAYMNTVKLIVNNRSRFFEDDDSFNKYLKENAYNADRVKENKLDIDQSFVDELKAILEQARKVKT